MQPEELFATVFVIAMFCGVLIVFMGLRQRSQQLEMRHRERMAMIERGQVPLDSPSAAARHLPAAPAASSRWLSIGIMIIGLGLALMMIISIAGDTPDVGVGIGGAIAIVGAAFVVRSLVIKPSSPAPKTIGPPEEPGL